MRQGANSPTGAICRRNSDTSFCGRATHVVRMQGFKTDVAQTIELECIPNSPIACRRTSGVTRPTVEYHAAQTSAAFGQRQADALNYCAHIVGTDSERRRQAYQPFPKHAQAHLRKAMSGIVEDGQGSSNNCYYLGSGAMAAQR
jgi:hypothetical protein